MRVIFRGEEEELLASSVFFFQLICDRNLELVYFLWIELFSFFCFKFIHAAIFSSCNFFTTSPSRTWGPTRLEKKLVNFWGTSLRQIVLMDLSLSLSLSIIHPLVNMAGWKMDPDWADVFPIHWYVSLPEGNGTCSWPLVCVEKTETTLKHRRFVLKGCEPWVQSMCKHRITHSEPPQIWMFRTFSHSEFVQIIFYFYSRMIVCVEKLEHSLLQSKICWTM